ncbi:MAG: lipopolysaccharide assembly protein LapB [Aliivibrio sp.]|nr:lipopolysaccharide assembly protein LapB [Aliivibrio sp.]
MPDFLLLILLVVAIFVGWLLGRKHKNTPHNLPSGSTIPTSYYRSLNLIISDSDSDEAVDSFIEAFEVTSTTLPTHLSMGDLLRNRGDVDGAIRIHQNLLARPSLMKREQDEAHLALAKDYAQAGLLDRAESLLGDMIDKQSELSTTALNQLVSIYQEQRDWQLAIDTGLKLTPRRLLRSKQTQATPLAVAMGHYCCELAEQKIAENEWRKVRALLKQALEFDRNSVRASLIWGRLDINAGRYSQAIKILASIENQEPLFMNEAISMIAHCYQQLDDVNGFIVYAETLLQRRPLTSVLIELVWAIQSRDGEEQAEKLLVHAMMERPTLHGLVQLVDLHQSHASDSELPNLALLKGLLDSLLANKPLYRCRECGFSGQQLHWLCPSCKGWGVVAPVIGVEGQ